MSDVRGALGSANLARNVLHPIVVVVFVLCAYFGPDLLSQWQNADGKINLDVTRIELLFLVLGVLIFVGELIGIIISTARFKIGQTISHLIALLVLSSTLIFGRDAGYLVQLFNVYAFPGRYQLCAQSAVQYAGQERFKMCSILADGSAYTMVIYDSGGQITGPRSELFRDFLRSIQSQVLSDCRVAPVKTLRDHFYFVQSDCDSQPE